MNKRNLRIIIIIWIILGAVLAWGRWALYDISNWDTTSCRTCVSSPLNELVETLLEARSGEVSRTDYICINSGEIVVIAEPIARRALGMEAGDITFYCDKASVCDEGDPLEVTPDSIEAKSSCIFRATIACKRTSGSRSECSIGLMNAWGDEPSGEGITDMDLMDMAFLAWVGELVVLIVWYKRL